MLLMQNGNIIPEAFCKRQGVSIDVLDDGGEVLVYFKYVCLLMSRVVLVISTHDHNLRAGDLDSCTCG